MEQLQGGESRARGGAGNVKRHVDVDIPIAVQ